MQQAMIILSFTLLALSGINANAGTPGLDQPLPTLEISDQGELLMNDDEFSFDSWSSNKNQGKVQVIQYIGGTRTHSKLFSLFTDQLAERFAGEEFTVTTIVNLDAAAWGSAGFVLSELKSSKREFPLSTIVVDEEGDGVKHWGLGDKGAILAIVDKEGRVRYVSQDAITPDTIDDVIAVMKSQLGS